jgi:uncharacterized protein
MKKIIFPQEIEVWYILPTIRKKIALKLVEKGLQQKKVAEIMGITPAAVCQYKSEKRAKKELFNNEMEDELEKSVENIIKDPHQLAEEIIRLNRLMKKKGIVCKLYSEICALKDCKSHCPYCDKNE